ncbi:hypothetical protein J7T55_005563, partial [Diaporthe amygdali]|uniref:uncharacterized protein n=1 Tax=Phomopsis amygdali TaxID=1214568 RepID=UPI0022FDBAD7
WHGDNKVDRGDEVDFGELAAFLPAKIWFERETADNTDSGRASLRVQGTTAGLSSPTQSILLAQSSLTGAEQVKLVSAAPKSSYWPGTQVLH